MTLDEARELLDVSAEAEGRALRRAYLRAVKRHPPERDPEGFARVREAFELCRMHVAWIAPPAPEAVVLELGEVPKGVVLPPPRDDACEELVGRAYDAELSMEERFEASEALLARAPEAADAHWARYDLLLAEGRRDDAMAVLRDARERGVPGFFETLAQDFAEHLTAQELAALADEVAPASLPNVAHALVAHHPELALRLFEQAFDVSEAQGRALWVDSVLEAVLQLESQERPEHGSRLMERLERHLVRTGERLGVESAARYALVHELMAVAGELPPELRVSLAHDISSLSTGSGGGQAPLFAIRQPRAAHRAARKLRTRAPSLHALFGGDLSPKQKPASSGTNVRLFGVLAIIIASGLVRLCTPASRPDSMARYRALDGKLGTLSELPVDPRRGSFDGSEFVRLQVAIASIRGRRCPAAGDLVCADLRAFASAFAAHRCVDARVALEAARAAPLSSGLAALEPADLTSLERAASLICPASVPPLPSVDASADASHAAVSSEENHETSP